jgi:hypothetical protein
MRIEIIVPAAKDVTDAPDTWPVYWASLLGQPIAGASLGAASSGPPASAHHPLMSAPAPRMS